MEWEAKISSSPLYSNCTGYAKCKQISLSFKSDTPLYILMYVSVDRQVLSLTGLTYTLDLKANCTRAERTNEGRTDRATP